MRGREYAAPAQLEALTGLRGVAAAWVFLHHWNLFRWETGNGIHKLAVGYLAVDMFFLLSGFIMAHAKYRQFRTPDGGAYLAFLAERFMRLYPANAAVLMLYALAVVLFPDVRADWPTPTLSATSFVTSLCLVQSWLGLPLGGWIAPGWSVSVELGAYAALPALLLLMRRLPSRGAAVAVAGGCLAAFVCILVLHGEHDPNVSVKGGFIRLACEFTAGAAIHEAWRRGLRVSAARGTAAACVLLAVAVLTRVPEAAFLALPASALLILLGAQGSGPACRMLASRPALFLGRVSYTLYLVHWPVLVFWRHYLGFDLPAWATVCLLGGTLGLASAVNALVEAPSHRLARRIGRGVGQRIGAVGTMGQAA